MTSRIVIAMTLAFAAAATALPVSQSRAEEAKDAKDAKPAKIDGTWKLTTAAASSDGSPKGVEIRLELKSDEQKIKGVAVVDRKSLDVVGETLKDGSLRLSIRNKSGDGLVAITAKLEKDSLKGRLSRAGQTQDFTGRRIAEKNKQVLKDRQQQGLR